MKKILLTLSTLLLTSVTFSQEPYDSLWNAPKTWVDCQRLKGQKVVVCPRPESLRSQGYIGFVKLDGTTYAKTPKNGTKSLYDSLANREFTVIDVPKRYSLLLADNRDTLFYRWLGGIGLGPQYVFITKGYVEKLTDSLKGSKYTYIGQGDVEIDPRTGEKVEYKPKQQFLFESVYIDEQYDVENAICALLKTTNGKVIFKPITMLNDVFIPTAQFNKLINKYGSYWIDLALQKKIKVGMPAKLVEMAWGEPHTINKSSHGPDQWCYNNQYVYIQNGKVSAWN